MQKGLVNKIQEFLELNNLADYELISTDVVKSTRPTQLEATLTIKIKKGVIQQSAS
ncbi:MAG: hypothetical protein ABI723_00905 [Bacteroidia bacterium]